MTKPTVVFAAITGSGESYEFMSRLELSAAGVHRPTRAGR